METFANEKAIFIQLGQNHKKKRKKREKRKKRKKRNENKYFHFHSS